MQDAPRGKKKIKKQWFVIPMREASFKPGEESGEKPFGTSGKGRFFTASFFFGRLEIQESKRQNQVIEHVDADQVLDANPSKEAEGAREERAESAQVGDRDTLDEQAEQSGLYQLHYDAADVEVVYLR